MSVNRDTFNQVMVPNYNPQQVIPVRGEGSRLWDQQDKDYIDLAAGIAVNALGHSHPELVATLKAQADKLWHLSNIFTNEPALELAQKLTEATFADRVYFCNSGAEANEAAFKLARKYAYDNFGGGQEQFEKHEIIAFNQSFHGRTLFTVTVGGQPKYREGFEPVPAGITHVPYNDLAALKAAISDKTCAVVLEPILGEGGIIPGDPDFIKGVRALCDQHDALMVLDEIQTGMGRTGKLFAYEGLGIEPDILTSAKALGCGFPIGAMLCTDKVAQSFQFGTHGSTYGGNPLGCAVASKALDIINQPQLLSDVRTKHDQIVAELNAINDEFDVFSEIRGQGLLIGAVLNETWQGKAGSFLPHSIAAGVMHLIAGPNVLRCAPSLIITDQEIAEGMHRLKQAITATLAEATS